MELLDLYDDYGKRTGRVIARGDKSVVLNENEHIALGVIFLENHDGKFLIQKTSLSKGGEYSSTGGHVDSGETPLEAIKREVKEELGIDISNDQIEEYGFLSYDGPLRYLFYLKKDISVEDIKIQEEEVEFVRYMSASEILQLIEEEKMLKSHGILFQELMKRLEEN